MATDINLNFDEYLVSKKIDREVFLKADPIMFAEWEIIFGKIHPDSFTAQKKFLINTTRRRYKLKD